jgi:thioredoxin-related protein
MNSARQFLLLGLAIIAAGCNAPTPGTVEPAPVAQGNARPDNITWFKGDVAAALETAHAQKKPILLYWGAQWCPPCHVLKETVFSEQAFIEKTRLFVAVYLDGDEAGAQRWGDTFHITGYPTMLVLASDQREISRISGGMDLNQYARVLDDALLDDRPMADILGHLAASSSIPATSDDCRRVAWNAWGLDEALSSASGDLANKLGRAANRCSSTDHTLGQRIEIFAAVAQASGDSPRVDPKILLSIQELLKSTGAADHYDALRYLAPEYFETLARSDPAAAKVLSDSYVAVMMQVAADPRFAGADQLGAVYAALLASNAVSAAESKTGLLHANAWKRVERELAALPTNAYLRSGIVTGVLEVMDALGKHEQAYALARREVETASYGFYYMSTLADICEALQRNDEALQWHERAYRESKGSATRFQWGANYLQALLRLAPTDETRIRTAGELVLGELAGSNGVYRRSRIRVEALNAKLVLWEKQAPAARKKTAQTLHNAYIKICGENCVPFLDESA